MTSGEAMGVSAGANAASRTILIMAGGTGGHIFPALAVADRLRQQGWRVVWLGTRTGMEARIVPQKGYAIEWVKFSGVRRSGWLRLATLPFFLLLAMVQSASALFRQRPDVVLGMGGFVSFPGGLMAALFRRPLVIHEQNSIAGLANRVLAGLADRVLAGFPDAFDLAHWKGGTLATRMLGVLLPACTPIWCGNPVRPEICALPDPRMRYGSRTGALKLFVFGGSLGAKALNDTVPEALREIAEAARPRVVHQAGREHAGEVAAAYSQAGVKAQVLPFVEDMASHYGESDLVLCRAGALTVAEIAAAGVASILVPYPHAVDDHQTKNARFLSEQGAAILLPQGELNARRLAQILCSLTRDKLLEMAKRARALARPEATRLVAEACMELAR